jgi:hypothetical protein
MGWKDVEDAAAHGEFAAFFDERHPRVSRPNQGRDERIPIRSFFEGQEFLYRLVKRLSVSSTESGD